jgi:diadenylate cyclase
MPLLTAVIQIAILYFAIYWVLYFLRTTRVSQVFAGILVAAVALALILRVESLHFDVLNSLIEMIANSLLVVLVIIFQPEIRRALAQLGSIVGRVKKKREIISEIVTASSEMARRKCGALIVIERNLSLQNYIDDAIVLDAKVHYLLLESLFYPKSPLHDGAVIIRGDRIVAASAILPLSRENIAHYLGTRHRAALGISEDSDAVAVVVSEETGSISVAYRGTLRRDLTARDLENLLEKLLILKDDLEFSEAVKIIDEGNENTEKSE